MQQSATKERNTKSKRSAASQPKAQNKDHLSVRDKVTPLNESQRQMLFALSEGLNVVAYGSAGTGKSFLACAHALEQIFAKRASKIVIVRSAVATRDMGFLPGTLEEKADPYKAPYKQIINQLCNNGTAWDILVKKEMIEFITSSYVRGITISDAIVIVDEYQNMNNQEVYSVLTRVGENCQVVLLGDTKQTDLNKKKEESCFDWVMKVTQKMPKWFDVVHFTPREIVRSGFCKDLIITAEELS